MGSQFTTYWTISMQCVALLLPFWLINQFIPSWHWPVLSSCSMPWAATPSPCCCHCWRRTCGCRRRRPPPGRLWPWCTPCLRRRSSPPPTGRSARTPASQVSDCLFSFGGNNRLFVHFTSYCSSSRFTHQSSQGDLLLLFKVIFKEASICWCVQSWPQRWSAQVKMMNTMLDN